VNITPHTTAHELEETAVHASVLTSISFSLLSTLVLGGLVVVRLAVVILGPPGMR
jgi:hypothetical protein